MRRPSTPAAILLVAAAALGAAAAHDALVPMQQQFSTRGAIFAIEQYRATLSPLLRGRASCRFQPSCSKYGLESVKKYGGIKGSWRAVKRIARCNPWTKPGTVDPP